MAKKIYQMKISIQGAKPPVWRRVLLASTITFEELHEIIQIIFNWGSYHLYEFSGKYANYKTSEELKHNDMYALFGRQSSYDMSKVQINKELKNPKDKVSYTYDFGDSWEHIILLEKIVPYDKTIQYPICTAGKRNGPLEDCGGIYSFNLIVDAIENPTSENQYFLDEDDDENYFKDFDPKEFDKNLINMRLMLMNDDV